MAMPTLSPVPPTAANPRITRIYDETRTLLRLPWVGALFQGYATYPDYLERAWTALRPSMGTTQFMDDAEAIGNAADEAVTRFYAPSYDAREVAARNLDLLAIRETVAAFHDGNPRLLLVATALRRAFSEGTVGGTARPLDHPEPYARALHESDATVTIELVDPSEATPPVAALFDDIKATLHLPLVNSDYRALALWPDYLALAWGEIKTQHNHPEYVTARRRLSGLAHTAVERFAAPVTVSRETLRQGGLSEADLANLDAILTLFADLLPGLILNVALCYRALTSSTAR